MKIITETVSRSGPVGMYHAANSTVRSKTRIHFLTSQKSNVPSKAVTAQSVGTSNNMRSVVEESRS